MCPRRCNFALAFCAQRKCMVLQVFDDPAVKRAARSIRALSSFRPRHKMWITLPVIEKMMAWTRLQKGRDRVVLLYALAYIFMLRLPSEALPMIVGPVADGTAQSIVTCSETELTLRLRRRKNRPFGGTLVRSCWCDHSRSTCPVHTFGRAVKQFQAGARLFPSITAKGALGTLRDMLVDLEVEDAKMYRTHDLRRGHVLDMQTSG